jgi:transposase
MDGHGYRVHVTPEWTGSCEAIMSMMAIMDRLVMSEESNGSAGGTGHPAAKKETHRKYAIELKRRIVEETFAPGATVAGVARRHGVNDNVVFEWRKQYRQGTLVDKRTPARKALPAPDLVRIAVIDHDGGVCPPPEASGHSVPLPERAGKAAAIPGSNCRAPGVIKIKLRNGIKVHVDADIDESALRRVLAAVREAA